jgi:DNA excision repair protein ERCC-4
MTIRPTIIIDTREQAPLTFVNLPSEPGTLDCGDYSIRGLTHLIALERKSVPDLLACVGRERERFERELQRLQAYRFRHLAIEASAADLEGGDWRSQVLPASVIGSLCAWAARYGVPVWFCGTHDACGRWVERILFQAARQVAKEVEVVASFVADAMRPAERKPRKRSADVLPVLPAPMVEAVPA